jgi:hypothetical protein
MDADELLTRLLDALSEIDDLKQRAFDAFSNDHVELAYSPVLPAALRRAASKLDALADDLEESHRK